MLEVYSYIIFKIRNCTSKKLGHILLSKRRSSVILEISDGFFFSFSWSILLNVTNLDYMEVGVDIKQRNKGHPKLTESNMKIYTSVVYILLVVQMYLSGPITYNQRNPFYYSKNHRPWPRIWGLLLFDIIINIFPPK